MLVVDTNILVPLFISGQRQRDVLALLDGDSAWCTEPFALVELVNVFATYVRSKLLAADAARRHLDEASNLLMPNLCRVSLRAVLDHATRYKVSAFDAHFLAVADAKQRKLITEDLKLRAAAPELTQSLDQALADLR